jgi:type I restriction-modification system DNA methylase subunit
MTQPLTKSKARVKQLGEVFTPPELVNEMLDRLPAELWTDPSKTYIDPACGTGNFLVEVVRRKIEAGSTPLQALETTYGIDIMEDNVLECRQRLLECCWFAFRW